MEQGEERVELLEQADEAGLGSRGLWNSRVYGRDTGLPMEIAPALAAEGWSLLTETDIVGVMFKSNGFPNRLVVTFDALSAFNHGRGSVSGTKAVLESQSDHMHIAYSGTAWYQSNDVERIVPIARAKAATYAERVLTGHSMGGYAALLFSGWLDATKTVSFAPQFSIDPEKVPFEQRFHAYSKDTAFTNDDMAHSISATADHLVVYDPLDSTDAKHYALISKHANVKPIKIPLCGHNPGLVLREAGLVRTVTTELIMRPGLSPEWHRKIRRGRRSSQRYFLNRAMALAQRGSVKAALDAANAAYVLAPKSVSVLETYFAILQSDGIWIGLAHALLRLIVHEQPEWTVYISLQDELMQNLKNQVALKFEVVNPSCRATDAGL